MTGGMLGTTHGSLSFSCLSRERPFDPSGANNLQSPATMLSELGIPVDGHILGDAILRLSNRNAPVFVLDPALIPEFSFQKLDSHGLCSRPKCKAHASAVFHATHCMFYHATRKNLNKAHAEFQDVFTELWDKACAMRGLPSTSRTVYPTVADMVQTMFRVYEDIVPISFHALIDMWLVRRLLDLHNAPRASLATFTQVQSHAVGLPMQTLHTQQGSLGPPGIQGSAVSQESQGSASNVPTVPSLGISLGQAPAPQPTPPTGGLGPVEGSGESSLDSSFASSTQSHSALLENPHLPHDSHDLAGQSQPGEEPVEPDAQRAARAEAARQSALVGMGISSAVNAFARDAIALLAPFEKMAEMLVLLVDKVDQGRADQRRAVELLSVIASSQTGHIPADTASASRSPSSSRAPPSSSGAMRQEGLGGPAPTPSPEASDRPTIGGHKRTRPNFTDNVPSTGDAFLQDVARYNRRRRGHSDSP